VAIVGNPNTGKTTLFNMLTGMRARTGNFPGTTVEHHTGRIYMGRRQVEVVDLPGLYSMRATTPDEHAACDVLLGRVVSGQAPSATVLVADATNLERSLFLASQVLALDIPVVIALNMYDVARASGMHIDTERLSKELDCKVVPVVAKTGEGLEALGEAVQELLAPAYIPLSRTHCLPKCDACGSCPFQARFSWTEEIANRCVSERGRARGKRTERLDQVLTHPVAGVGVFLLVMLAVFLLIFQVATVPMDLVDGLFAQAGSWVESVMPESLFRSLLVDGVIAGVGGILVFLPQICVLFFFLTLLEDTGYLARAAFVMDRLMRRVGLPGNAFVPLLSAHACAIPAIMGARVIRDWRDRLVTILIAPLMSCSARIPVYVMLTTLLFPNAAWKASLAFTGAYVTGLAAALAVAWGLKKTILPGETKPLALELPNYRIPHLRTALLVTLEQALSFIKQAGTFILVFSVILWALATFPRTDTHDAVTRMTAQAEQLEASGQADRANTLFDEANRLDSRYALEHSLLGRLGRVIEPAVAPLGFDWQIGIGVLSSFAAREVIVSTLAVVYGVGEERVEEEPASLYDSLRRATRTDGSPVYTTATCVSLLVFYILAMQCFPTLAVTRKETGTWKWAAFQWLYMTALAYSASLLTYQVFRLLST
jgi:ferrous iron transport protein B